jgi:hypothetical protein
MDPYQISPGMRVAIKAYSRFPRHWRYSQRQYVGKIATVEKIEHDTVNNNHGYRLDIDNHFHRWYYKDFAAVNVTAQPGTTQAKPKVELVVEEVPKRCPKCKSPDLDSSELIETVSLEEIHRIIFCDGCGANIILKYKFYSASCVPIR